MVGGERPQRILTVSELIRLIRDQLETEFPFLWVEGEVSNLRVPASGHLYFSLKDRESQLRAVLFRAGAQRLRFAVQDGMQVIACGRLTVYEPRGDMQMIVESVEPKGVGALQLAFEQLKAKLACEGLFEESRKRPLPLLPRRVGLVTSLAGAALHDMLTVLEYRCPTLSVVVCPVAVQGDDAAPQIAKAIRRLSASKLVDVMIVGRGGGSWEDLWCFNEEVVVRAIVESKVPVVSAVGHETDVTLADFAADYRAPTPSAAAEAVAPVRADLLRTIRALHLRQDQAVRRRLGTHRRALAAMGRALALVRVPVQRFAQRLDELAGRLDRSFRETLSLQRHRLVTARQSLGSASPRGRIRSVLVLLPQLRKRLEQGVNGLLAFRRQAVRSMAATLDSLSPLAILGRGYSILQTVSEGTIVKRAGDVEAGDELRARLAEGQLLCEVRKIFRET
jgi:exodeoxyribonuclease VII large subunit